eukprot:333814-Amphidinium_carterae.1
MLGLYSFPTLSSLKCWASGAVGSQELQQQEEVEDDTEPFIARVLEDLVVIIIPPPKDIDLEGDIVQIPGVGDVVQFAGGAVGYVVAVCDLTFGVALHNRGSVAVGEKFDMQPDAPRPTIMLPQSRSAWVDCNGLS